MRCFSLKFLPKRAAVNEQERGFYISVVSLERPMRRGIGVGALCVWGALMVWIGAIMLGRHLVALPAQTGDDAALAAALSEARARFG